MKKGALTCGGLLSFRKSTKSIVWLGRKNVVGEWRAGSHPDCKWWQKKLSMRVGIHRTWRAQCEADTRHWWAGACSGKNMSQGPLLQDFYLALERWGGFRVFFHSLWCLQWPHLNWIQTDNEILCLTCLHIILSGPFGCLHQLNQGAGVSGHLYFIVLVFTCPLGGGGRQHVL